MYTGIVLTLCAVYLIALFTGGGLYIHRWAKGKR